VFTFLDATKTGAVAAPTAPAYLLAHRVRQAVKQKGRRLCAYGRLGYWWSDFTDPTVDQAHYTLEIQNQHVDSGS
jgi:hypothetical protein